MGSSSQSSSRGRKDVSLRVCVTRTMYRELAEATRAEEEGTLSKTARKAFRRYLEAIRAEQRKN